MDQVRGVGRRGWRRAKVLFFKKGACEGDGLEELEKKNITSLLLQNGSGERHGLEELDKKSQVVCFKMDQVRGVVG